MPTPTLTNLFTFVGRNGSQPAGGLLTDTAGDLFGTTNIGGANNLGTVFELPASGAGYGSLITLVSFSKATGSGPDAGLIADAAGDLFGTTQSGGASGGGTVFEVVRTA